MENIIEFNVSDTNVIFDDGDRKLVDCDVEDDEVVQMVSIKKLKVIVCVEKPQPEILFQTILLINWKKCRVTDILIEIESLLDSGMLLQHRRLLQVISTGLVNIKLFQK